MTAREEVTLGELTFLFARIGCLAYGGGGATLAMLHQEFCVRRSLVTEEEFQVLFGISRVLPGMNLLSLTVLLGHRFHGLLGALAALSGLTVPCFLVIVAGCALVSGDRPNPYLQGIVRGLTPTAAALLLHTGWQLSRSALQKQEALARGYWLLVAGAGAVASVDGRVHPAWIVLAGALTGILLARPILGRDR